MRSHCNYSINIKNGNLITEYKSVTTWNCGTKNHKFRHSENLLKHQIYYESIARSCHACFIVQGLGSLFAGSTGYIFDSLTGSKLSIFTKCTTYNAIIRGEREEQETVRRRSPHKASFGKHRPLAHAAFVSVHGFRGGCLYRGSRQLIGNSSSYKRCAI